MREVRNVTGKTAVINAWMPPASGALAQAIFNTPCGVG